MAPSSYRKMTYIERPSAGPVKRLFNSICGHDPACANEQYRSKKGPAHMFENPHLFLEPKDALLK